MDKQMSLSVLSKEKETLHYSRISVLLCLLHIPYKMKNGYFCSQFVVEMLELTGSIFLRNEASLYLPNHLPAELKRQRCLKEIMAIPHK